MRRVAPRVHASVSSQSRGPAAVAPRSQREAKGAPAVTMPLSRMPTTLYVPRSPPLMHPQKPEFSMEGIIREPLINPLARTELKTAKKPKAQKKRGRKTQPLESPFPQTAQKFSDIYHPNAFHSDKTSFIRKMEADPSARAVLALFPRQFGKTVLLDTLAQYYDVKNKKNFDDLFGGTDIGRDPTPLHSNFMVLVLDFATLNTASYESFNVSFNAYLSSEIENFCEKYKVPSPPGRDAVDMFQTLGRSLGSPLLVLVDEYDKAVMKTTRQNPMLQPLPGSPPSSLFSYALVSSFLGTYTRFWAACKTHMSMPQFRIVVTGTLPVAMKAFGTNIFTTIREHRDFDNVCGLTQEDVLRGLSYVDPPLPDATKQELLAHMAQQLSGYRFREDAPASLFNPARVMCYLDSIQQCWEKTQSCTPADLAELPKHSPVKAALESVSSGRYARHVIMELLTTGAEGMHCTSTDPTLDFPLFTVPVEPSDLLSFLYFAGAVTHAPSTAESRQKPRPRLCVPNLEAHSAYVEEANRLLSLVNKSEIPC